MRTINHYEVLEKLGEGGMGVVWKARDTRLERFVALKLLPPAKTSDPARRQRFVQEARAASALNHPRIITIYEIDRQEGPEGADFIAMEYVAGRTLDQLIPAKGLRIPDALKYAIQIADALATAHAAGIIHRDLKPANVMVTEKGDIKVLDFGLAKLLEQTALSETDHTRTVAVDAPHTEEGTIIGTAAYMSPEQAEGKKVDVRSDIFSFGTLLYEMLTGRRAFQGESKMATLAAILNREPEPLEKLNPTMPRELIRIVQRCLRKDLERRAHSMQDLKLALEEIREDSESGLMLPQGGAPASKARQRSRTPMLVGGLAAVLAAAGAGYWLWHGAAKPESAMQATPLTTFPGYESSPSFSPDGNQVAFSGGPRSGQQDIYVQLIGSGRPLRLTTDTANISPAWSPDGRNIAFAHLHDGGHVTVTVVPALGGAEREVAALGLVLTPQRYSFQLVDGWTPDGRWLLITDQPDSSTAPGLFLLSAETGEKRRLTSPRQGIAGDYHAALSPDGRTIVFLRVENSVGRSSYISDVYSLPLTADFRPAGDPRPLTSDHATHTAAGWAAGGTEIIFSSNRSGTLGLWRMPASGSDKPQRLPVGDGAATFAISTRGNRMVYEQVVNVDSNIWRIDLTAAGTAPTQFISSTRQDEGAAYSPDGKRIAFRSDRSGTLEIWTCDADGSNAAQLTRNPNAGSPHWSWDNSQITFDSTVNGRWQVFVMPARGGQAKQLTSDGGTRPSFSRDGKWIYFALATNGVTNVWKVPAVGGPIAQVTKNGGNNPVEWEDGMLYYLAGEEIRKSALDGTGETTVLKPGSANLHVPTRDGIYYQTPLPAPEFRFHSFATGTSKLIFKPTVRLGLGMTVSPDGHWLLYNQVDGAPGSDLVLVENFH